MQTAPRRRPLTGAILLLISVAVSPPARAQSSGGNGFLFDEPIGSLALRLGYGQSRASGDLFGFVRDELTLDPNDFGAITGAADLSFRLTSRFDLTFGAGYSQSQSQSEFRDWIDNNDQPIEQTTWFKRIPLSISTRFYVMPRGHRYGQFAWVPSQFSPYIGAGVGMTYYKFRQNGDFVDFQSLNVFHDDFQSSGWAGAAHVMAGAEWALSSRFALTGEGRYSYSQGEVKSDFVGFDSIDLSGLSFTAGVLVRFSKGSPR